MEKTTNFLGFHSISDFCSSQFRFDDWSFNGLVAFFGVITSFITGFVWDSPEAVWTLWVLMGVDWLTGIIKSVRNKEFISYKLFRMPLYFVVTSFVLGISWWMSKGSPIFFILPGLVMAGFYSVYFISLLENLGEIGLLPKGLVNVLKSRFGLKVIVDKYTNKEEKES
jgi:phage-related holin